jgi:HPt (histidine-containing phosphotransfer) domain-containing protein
MSEAETRLPPVDLNCLERTTAGDSQHIQELAETYLQTTADQLKQIQRALSSNTAIEVKILAHSCMGASALLGMTAIMPPLRRLEEMANQRELTRAPDALAQAWNEWDRIKLYWNTYKEENPSETRHASSPRR